MANEASNRGFVLFAALVFVAFLAVVVTAQLERLPFASAESRSALVRVQRELEVDSALQLAIGILRGDAAANDYDWFGDLWVREHTAQLGQTQIKVRMGDSVFFRTPEDSWVRQGLGIPPDIPLVATEDRNVHDLFARTKPNVNTATVASLRDSGGMGGDAVAWLKRTRQGRALTCADDLRDAPGQSEAGDLPWADGVTFTSPLFLAEATIRREGESAERWHWVLRREGEAIAVVYTRRDGAMR